MTGSPDDTPLDLQPFIEAHAPLQPSPHTANLDQPAYESVPPALIALWRQYGLGLYGNRQFCLIDPAQWQETLNRWILSPPSETKRIPIMLLPTGNLIYYRKLTDTDEDVAMINPLTRQTEVLSWDLAAFFNEVLLDPESLQNLAPLSLIMPSEDLHGALKPGEIFASDPTLASAGIHSTKKHNGLAFHAACLDRIDSENNPAPDPRTIHDTLPKSYRRRFAGYDKPKKTDAGLFISRYLDWYIALGLNGRGKYRLLYWKINHRTHQAEEMRFYKSSYKKHADQHGDTYLTLKIQLTAASLGSDARLTDLAVIEHDGETMLLSVDSFESMASDIGNAGNIRDMEAVLIRASLSAPKPEDLSEGMRAPPREALPKALDALVLWAPLKAVVTEVIETEEFDGSVSLAVMIDKGTDDGIQMNMPLYSDLASGRDYKGWAWGLEPSSCRVGVDDETATEKASWPQIGDIMLTRR